MRRPHPRWLASSLIAVATLCILAVAGCASTSTSSTGGSSGTPTAKSPANIVGLPGYQVTVFAQGGQDYNGPDSVIDDGSYIYIDYQNTTAKDCTDAATAHSTVVQYSLDGKALKTFNVPGHSDGLREDPSTHLLWATSCEDGNPRLVTIDPSSGTITPYTFPPTPHGGGYDDLAFLNGKVFIAASNPNLNAAGVNVFPAVDSVTLSGSKVQLTPVLMGNASAQDLIAKASVTLNEVDPDSLSVDAKGDLVLVNQAGSELVYISNPGTSQQSVSRLPVGTQLDDTVFPTQSKGRLLVTDGVTNTTYWIRANTFVPGSIYTEAPDDSGVAGFVGVVDPATGIVYPQVIGFIHPTGMLFVPNSGS